MSGSGTALDLGSLGDVDRDRGRLRRTGDLLELRGILGGGGAGEFRSLLSGVPGEERRLSAAAAVAAASAADVPGGGNSIPPERRKSGDPTEGDRSSMP